MSLDTKNLGTHGEEIAADYLVNKGYLILQRNYRAKSHGEVDIICIHPHRKTVVFVEVKTKIGEAVERPEEAITKAKLSELKKMVDYYYTSFPETKTQPQIDAVAVILTKSKDVDSLEHFENISL